MSIGASIRGAIQAALSHIGVRLQRIPECVDPVLPFDVLRLAIIAERARVGPEDFYFIQVGAHDGILYDNLNPLIREFGLPGCLIEPLPDVFERLRATYADQPDLSFRNSMIGDDQSSGVIHRFKPDAKVPDDFFHGLARQDADYIRQRAEWAGLKDSVEAVRCKVENFPTILRSLGRSSISLLYVDTEGSDDKIVMQALETGLRPPIIQYEWSEMTPRRRCDLKTLLARSGYRFIDVGADTVCLRVDD